MFFIESIILYTFKGTYKVFKKYKMAGIIFRGAKIQKGFRVKIPKPIVDTLNIKPSENILIKFDLDKKEIIIKVEKKLKNKR